MARLVKPKYKEDKLCMRNNLNNGQLIIVDNGKNPYVVSLNDKSSIISLFSGPKTLEKFARAVLNELGKGDV